MPSEDSSVTALNHHKYVLTSLSVYLHTVMYICVNIYRSLQQTVERLNKRLMFVYYKNNTVSTGTSVRHLLNI